MYSVGNVFVLADVCMNFFIAIGNYMLISGFQNYFEEKVMMTF